MPPRILDPISGTTRATGASIRTTSSSAAGTRVSSPSSTRRRARSCGGWDPTIGSRAPCAHSDRSLASIPHLIPKGLPGAGNLLVFDNGGASIYGDGNPVAPTGANVVARINSRVLEINPVTFEKIWEYSISGQERFLFASHYVSSAQRLPNGNTLIDEGADGRLFEVTSAKEIVWEYVNPYFA